jgi:hypothetical protein
LREGKGTESEFNKFVNGLADDVKKVSIYLSNFESFYLIFFVQEKIASLVHHRNKIPLSRALKIKKVGK